MPEICRFYGIVIRMFFEDHDPPHFHATYAGSRASFEIDSCEVIKGRFPSRATQLVVEWARMHRAELLADWELAHAGEIPARIAPLER